MSRNNSPTRSRAGSRAGSDADGDNSPSALNAAKVFTGEEVEDGPVPPVVLAAQDPIVEVVNAHAHEILAQGPIPHPAPAWPFAHEGAPEVPVPAPALGQGIWVQAPEDGAWRNEAEDEEENREPNMTEMMEQTEKLEEVVDTWGKEIVEKIASADSKMEETVTGANSGIRAAIRGEVTNAQRYLADKLIESRHEMMEMNYNIQATLRETKEELQRVKGELRRLSQNLM
eukprot:g10996.t1